MPVDERRETVDYGAGRAFTGLRFAQKVVKNTGRFEQLPPSRGGGSETKNDRIARLRCSVRRFTPSPIFTVPFSGYIIEYSFSFFDLNYETQYFRSI